MTKQALKNFTMLSVVLMLTSVSVAAQSERSEITSIPFNFTAGEKTLPAGEYVAKPDRKSSGVWVIQSRDGRVSAFFTTNAVQASKTQQRTRLIFNRYGDQYFLSQIWITGNNSGRELFMPSVERELVKNKSERQRKVIVNGSARRD